MKGRFAGIVQDDNGFGFVVFPPESEHASVIYLSLADQQHLATTIIGRLASRVGGLESMGAPRHWWPGQT